MPDITSALTAGIGASVGNIIGGGAGAAIGAAVGGLFGGTSTTNCPTVDKYGHPITLRSPREASQVYGFDSSYFYATQFGQGAPRPKFLFYAEFTRADSVRSDNYGLIIKTIERPNIKPETQQLNQYNKKRQIYTGFKTNEINVTFLDTSDGRIMRLWNDYSTNYFGDFRQSDPNAWNEGDVVGSQFFGNGNGFGFNPKTNGYQNDFFSKLDIYQVASGTFIQVTLVNPRITQFDPDELDYESSQPATLRMTLAYEAILYPNGSTAQPISASPSLSTVFQGQLNGNVFNEPLSAGLLTDFAQTALGAILGPSLSQLASPVSLGLGGVIQKLAGYSQGSPSPQGAGSLSLYGNYNFGDIKLNNVPVNGAMIASQNASTTVGGLLPNRTNTAAVLATAPSIQPGIDGAAYDVAAGAVSGPGGLATSSTITQTLATNVLSIATITGTASNQQVIGSGGLTLSPAALSLRNERANPYSQYGVNQASIPAFQAAATAFQQA